MTLAMQKITCHQGTADCGVRGSAQRSVDGEGHENPFPAGRERVQRGRHVAPFCEARTRCQLAPVNNDDQEPTTEQKEPL